MNRIVLTEGQSQQLDPLEPVEIRDADGRLVAFLPPELAREMSRINRRRASKERRYTGEQIQRGLKALEEAWEREGPFDLERAKEIMRQTCAA